MPSDLASYLATGIFLIVLVLLTLWCYSHAYNNTRQRPGDGGSRHDVSRRARGANRLPAIVNP